MNNRFVGIAAIALALAGCTDVASEHEATAQEDQQLRMYGRVDGTLAGGGTTPLSGVRVVVRSLQFGAGDAVVETITDAQGRYGLNVPNGWASVTYERDGYASASRTAHVTGATSADVRLTPAIAGSEFLMPSAGEPDAILAYDSDAGRDYMRLRIEAGDLVDAYGRPAHGKVTAHIAAPHPRDTHKDAFPHSLYAADDVGVSTLDAFGLGRMEFYQGDDKLELAEGESIDWEISVAPEQRDLAASRSALGEIHDYAFDAESGLWQARTGTVTYENGVLHVERKSLGDASVGTPSALPFDDVGEFAFRSSDTAAKCTPPGKSAMLLLTMSNPLTPVDVSSAIIRSVVSYLAQGKAAKVLVVRDDNHNNEFANDHNFIGERVTAAGYAVTVMNEPSTGLRPQDVAGYDVVWMTNPGHPMDDKKTLETLHEFRLAGGGFVLSGDDMTFSKGGFDMSPYTFTKHVSNGTTTCGVTTDNNAGAAWRVTFENSEHAMSSGLNGLTFLYGDDLDHSTALNDGEEVLAWGVLEGYPSCKMKIPVVIALDFEKSSQYTPCQCDVDNDCSGHMHCDGGECLNCAGTGFSCVADGDCCGDLACNDGTCGEACQDDGDSCAGSTDCCGTMTCVQGTCASCNVEGADCAADNDCCGGLLCVEGTCQSCRDDGEPCGDDGDCCGMGSMACNLSTSVETVSDNTACAGDRVIDVTLRDFSKSHADFEYRNGSETGIVANRLGADGKPVYAGSPNTYTTNGKLLFDQWYNDVAGVNKTIPWSIELDEVGPGLYQYKNNAFFPIDGQGYGNEGNSHNYHFTLEMHTDFVYRGGEVFTFTGDDDLFAFINDGLAIDLGGVHGKLSRTVDLDTEATRLGLVPGNVYPLDIFFAERHTTASNFRIDTTIGCLGQRIEKTVTELRCEDAPSSEPDCGGGEGVVGLDEVSVSGGASVRTSGGSGDVASNGTIKVTGGGLVQGNATTAGSTITVNGGGSIGGNKTSGADSVYVESTAVAFALAKLNNKNGEIPSVLRNNKAVSPYKNGELDLQANDDITLPAGDYSLDELTVTASAKLKCTGVVRMFVSGKVTIAGNARVNEDGGCALTILSNQDDNVSFTASTITRAFVFAPQARVMVAGSASLYGGALGWEVDLSGSGKIFVEGSPIEAADACRVVTVDPELPALPDLPALPS